MAGRKPQYVVIEIQLPDGWVSMYIGQLVKRSDSEIVLEYPCFIKDTGRRHLFFAGKPDRNAEWEPSGSEASFPALGTIITRWPHSFDPFKVPR